MSAAVITACQQKSVPVITARKTAPPSTTISIYAPPGTVQPDTSAGKIFFMNRCSRCHGLPEPTQFTASRWEGILESMIPRTGLDKESAVHVRAYIMTGAVK